MPFDVYSQAGADAAFATAAQGALADSATQPGDLGTAAAADASDFATAAQGAKADTAVQPADLTAVRARTATDMPAVVTLIAGSTDETPIVTNCTTTGDTTNTRVGGRAHKMTMAAATTATLSLDPVPPATGDQLSVPPAQAVCVWFYVPDAAKVTTVGVYLYTDAALTSNPGRWSRSTADSPSQVINTGWNLLRVPADFHPNTTQWGSVYRVTVFVTTNAATEVTIGQVYLECPTKARLLFIADRGYRSFLTTGYPRLKAAGVPVTWATDITLMGTGSGDAEAITWAEIDTLAGENRNSISFHGWDGAPTAGMTAAQLQADNAKAIKFLQAKGHQGRMWRAAFVQGAAAQWASLREQLIGSASGVDISRPTPWPPLDMMRLPRYTLDNNAQTTATIDAQFAYLETTHMLELRFIHGIGSGTYDATPALFNYYMDKVEAAIQAGWLEAVTFEQLFAESGGRFVNAAGSVFAEYVDVNGTTVRKVLL